MDEGGCNDDTGTKELGDKEGPLGHAGTRMAASPDGEPSTWSKVSVWKNFRGNGDEDLPSREPTRMTKMDEILTPILPSYSLLVSQ